MIDLIQIITTAIINTLSGLAANAFLIILVIIIYRGLKKQIKQTGHEIVKNIPKWIQDYNKMLGNDRVIEHARKSMEMIKHG